MAQACAMLAIRAARPLCGLATNGALGMSVVGTEMQPWGRSDSKSEPIKHQLLHNFGAPKCHQLFPSIRQLSSETKDNAAPPTIWNAPNLLSIGRAVSGPFIAYLILQDSWPLAFGCLAVSGATDWLDGYLARKLNQHSVLGSYLDPVGDKVLICSVIAALTIKGLIPMWVAAVILGRDVAFVLGLTIHRFNMLNWRPTSAAQFFNVETGSAAAGSPQMPYMQPIMISKVNTVLQLALLSGCVSKAWLGWPGDMPLAVLEYTTAGTTLLTTVIYVQKYVSGKLV